MSPKDLKHAVFITGIGTGIGKTLVSAILAEALQADYWKPVQAGVAAGTDSEWVRSVLSNSVSRVHPERYRLQLAASPHIAAREEGIRIDSEEILKDASKIGSNQQALGTGPGYLIMEGAGGLMVPLNEQEFVIDLVCRLKARIILVSRNYLGSINHSLLTAAACKAHLLDIAGWVFNDQYLHYEEEIVAWTGIPKIASIPYFEKPGKAFVREQADLVRDTLKQLL